MAIPYRLFLFNFLFFLTPIFAFIYAIVLSFVVKKDTIIISRSYFPSLVSLFLYKIKKIEYIFDTRSLFIDENTLNNNIIVDGSNYRMWKYFEEKILINSHKTIAVSLKQEEYYKKINPSVEIELIPCYIMPIQNITLEKQLNLRYELEFSKDDIVICYYGSLDNGWNNIDMYSDFFNECIKLNYKVLIISQNYKTLINDSRVKHKNIVLLNTDSLNNYELLEYAQISDYGVVLMKKIVDWETRLSVKFVEYLNAGLQVIAGEYVGEAVRYINNDFSNRGIIYRNKTNILKLNNKSLYDRRKIDKLFGYNNLKKIYV
jgi:hypothetical protein